MEHRFELVDGEGRIDEPGAILALLGLGLVALTLRGQVADDGFQHIDERHHALDAAELIGHERGVPARFFERLEQLDAVHRLRHDERRRQEVFEAGLDADGRVRPQGLHRHHAEHLVAVVLIDRKMRVAAGDDLAPVDLLGVVDVEENDLRPRRHDRGDGQLVEAEHALDHLLFGLVEDARLEALLNQDVHLLVRHGGFAATCEAEGLEQEVGDGAEDFDDGRNHPRHPLQGAGDQPGHALRVAERDALGDEFADHEGEERDEAHHPTEGDVIGPWRQHRKTHEPHRHLIGHGRSAERARQNAAQCDAHLHGGEEAGRFRGQLKRGQRAVVALVRELFQPGLPGGNNGDLRHGKETVGHQQEAKNEQLGEDSRHGKEAKPTGKPPGRATLLPRKLAADAEWRTIGTNLGSGLATRASPIMPFATPVEALQDAALRHLVVPLPKADSGPVAQRSEQRTHNPLVQGSNPCGPIPPSERMLGCTH